MKRYVFLLMLSTSMLVNGCTSRKLTRGRAEKLINEAPNFHDVLEALCVGRNTSLQSSLEGFVSSTLPVRAPSVSYGKWYKTLSDAGLVELKWGGTQSFFGVTLGTVETKLTAKGKQYAVGSEFGADQPVDLFNQINTQGKFQLIKMCERRVDTITGIQIPEGEATDAHVEFTWKFTNPTPFETAVVSSEMCKLVPQEFANVID